LVKEKFQNKRETENRTLSKKKKEEYEESGFKGKVLNIGGAKLLLQTVASYEKGKTARPPVGKRNAKGGKSQRGSRFARKGSKRFTHVLICEKHRNGSKTSERETTRTRKNEGQAGKG